MNSIPTPATNFLRKMNDFSQQNIVLNINKPLNFSSAKVVAIVKRLTQAKKVGHGGTLDPLASGVLPVALNKATKTFEQMKNSRKKYFFRVTFGEFRDTDDAEGKVVESSEARPLREEIISVLPQFVGAIKQAPSRFSAIKINGKRAYELAREGVEFEMKEREVMIYEAKLLAAEQDFCEIEIECSGGTYVRSFARDLCKKLGVCGYVSLLTRTQVGDFFLKDAMTLDQLAEKTGGRFFV